MSALFGHHPDPAVDYCIEVEELEAIAESERLGLSGFGHEQDRETLDSRIVRALDFRVGGDPIATKAKRHLLTMARSRGYHVDGEIAYAGQPIPRSTFNDSDNQREEGK